MRTTVRLADDLLRKAKARARRDGTTLTALIEEGLAIVLAEDNPGKGLPLPISKADGGLQAGVDLNDARGLEDLLSSR